MTSKQAILNEVVTARDEARLRLHLFSLEARERWYELEAALDGVERRLRRESERASQEICERAREVTRSARQFVEHQTRASELATPVGHVMRQDVPSCLPYASLKHACILMREAGFGALPVLDEDRKLLGMVTERDLCEAACLQGKRFSDMTVDTALGAAVRSCAPEDAIGRVLEIMGQAQAQELPVVDSEGRVVGMISLSALARHLAGTTAPKPGTSGALLKTMVAIAQPAPEYSTAAE